MTEWSHDADGSIRLTLRGVLDTACWTGLRGRLQRATEEAGGDFVLDLTNVSYIDGPAVGAIAFLFKRLASRHRRLRVAGVNGQPLALLRDHGLSRVLALPRPARPPHRRNMVASVKAR